jgi:hypothetical protein
MLSNQALSGRVATRVKTATWSTDRQSRRSGITWSAACDHLCVIDVARGADGDPSCFEASD